MNMYNRNEPVIIDAQNSFDAQAIMRQVFTWMTLGLALTAVVAFATVFTPLVNLVANPIVLMVAMIAEFGIVMGISLGFNRLSAGAATALFFVYAALNGFTLALVLLAFSIDTLFLAFIATSALFAAMAIIGYTTHLDLTRIGTYLIMGVIGLVIAMVVNMFVGSGPLDLIISGLGVLIFTGLTAYDTQRISRMAAQLNVSSGGEGTASKIGIYGALKLYLDFINLFLFILRFFGGRRR